MENFDWGIILGVVGLIVTVYFGSSQIIKIINKNKIVKSHNIKIGKKAKVNIKQSNSHNTTLSNDSKKDGE